LQICNLYIIKNSFSQEFLIKGKVLENDYLQNEKLPIKDVEIKLLNSNKFCYSNDKGNFKIIDSIPPKFILFYHPYFLRKILEISKGNKEIDFGEIILENRMNSLFRGTGIIERYAKIEGKIESNFQPKTEIRIGFSGLNGWYSLDQNGSFNLSVSSVLFSNLPDTLLAVLLNPKYDDQVIKFPKNNFSIVETDFELTNYDIFQKRISFLNETIRQLKVEIDNGGKNIGKIDSLSYIIKFTNKELDAVSYFAINKILSDLNNKIDDLKTFSETQIVNQNQLSESFKIFDEYIKPKIDGFDQDKIIQEVSKKISFLNLKANLGLDFSFLFFDSGYRMLDPFSGVNACLWIRSDYQSDLAKKQVIFDSHLTFGSNYLEADANFGLLFNIKSCLINPGFSFEGLYKRNPKIGMEINKPFLFYDGFGCFLNFGNKLKVGPKFVWGWENGMTNFVHSPSPSKIDGYYSGFGKLTCEGSGTIFKEYLLFKCYLGGLWSSYDTAKSEKVEKLKFRKLLFSLTLFPQFPINKKDNNLKRRDKNQECPPGGVIQGTIK